MPEGSMDFLGLEDAAEEEPQVEAVAEEPTEEAAETPVEAPESPSMPLQDEDEGVDTPEEPEEPQEGKELSAEDMLAQVREAYTEPEKPEGLSQADIDRALDERMAQLAKPEPEAPAAVEPGPDPELQAFQALLERAPEEERAELIVNFQQLREKKLRAEMMAKIDEDKKAREQASEKEQSVKQLRENLDWGLRAASNMGGMKAAVVKEFVESGDYERLLSGRGWGSSQIAQVLATDPRALYAGQSVLFDVMAAADLVNEQFRMKQQQPQPEGEQPKAERKPAATRTTAVAAKASPQPKQPKKKSPEQLYAESIEKAGNELKEGLPFLAS